MSLKVKIIFFGLICALSMKNDFSSMKLMPGTTQIFWTAMYSRQDTPAGWNTPYVSVNLTARALGDIYSESLSFEILIYNYSSRVGYSVDSHIEYCCTPILISTDICSNIHSAIYDTNGNIHYFKKVLTRPIEINEKVLVYTKGIYVLQLSYCSEGIVPIILDGTAEWRNPYGYLPGDAYMKLPMAGIFALGYLLVVLIYGFLSIKYRKILMYLQFGILTVLIYATVEHSAWYFYRLGTNNVGHYSFSALFFVILLANINKTITRVLVLLIGMGVGVVKWTIGTARMKIAFLAIFYLFFAFLFQLSSEISILAKKEILSPFLNLIIIMPNAFLDTLFYYWIVLSLIRTIQQLTLRRQIMKLEMYKQFLAVLLLVGAIELIVLSYRTYLHFSGKSISWQHVWMLEAYRELLYFIIITAIGFLWRPRKNNMRYGYAEFFEDDDACAEEIQMETIRVTTKEEDSSSGKKLKKVKMTTFDKGVMSIDLPSEEDETDLTTERRKME